MNKDTRFSGVLHVLLHLEQEDSPQTSNQLSKTMGTNAAVFRRTMAGLRNAGYVQSGKGHGGGWTLKKPLSQITLLDVFEALGHANIFSFGLRNEKTNCKVEGAVNMALSESMNSAQSLLLNNFQHVTLEQIAGLVKKANAIVDVNL